MNGKEKIELSFFGILLSIIAAVGSWLPTTRVIAIVMVIIAIVLGILSLIINLKGPKKLSVLTLLGSLLILIMILITSPVTIKGPDFHMSLPKFVKKTKEPRSYTYSESTSNEMTGKESLSTLKTLTDLAQNSKTVETIEVSKYMKVSSTAKVKPGVYDFIVIEGSGNIQGDRANDFGPFINFLGAQNPLSPGFPSTIRIILFEGDQLELSGITKIKLVAVNEVKEMTTSLKNGEYIVGRDLKEGKYRLSTNATLNKKYRIIGWGVTIDNLETKTSRTHYLNLENKEPVIDVKNGEIITARFDNTKDGHSGDEDILRLTPVE